MSYDPTECYLCKGQGEYGIHIIHSDGFGGIEGAICPDCNGTGANRDISQEDWDFAHWVNVLFHKFENAALTNKFYHDTWNRLSPEGRELWSEATLKNPRDKNGNYYRTKFQTVKAVRWMRHGDHPAVRYLLPLDDMLLTGMGGATIRLTGISSTSTSSNRNDFGVLGTEMGPREIVSPGDWIVEDHKGNLKVIRPFEFDYKFEQVSKFLEDRQTMFAKMKDVSVGVY